MYTVYISILKNLWTFHWHAMSVASPVKNSERFPQLNKVFVSTVIFEMSQVEARVVVVFFSGD